MYAQLLGDSVVQTTLLNAPLLILKSWNPHGCPSPYLEQLPRHVTSSIRGFFSRSISILLADPVLICHYGTLVVSAIKQYRV